MGTTDIENAAWEMLGRIRAILLPCTIRLEFHLPRIETQCQPTNLLRVVAPAAGD